MHQPSLRLRGSIQNVLFSRVEQSTLSARPLRQSGFSFGLGAVHKDVDQALGHLGELITVPGLTAILDPANPEKAALFSEPGDFLHTPFNAELVGIEKLPVRPLEFAPGETITASELWKKVILHEWGSLKAASPLVGAVYVAHIQTFRGAWLKRPPVRQNAPGEGALINDPAVHADWFGVYPESGYRHHLAVVVGVALNRASSEMSTLKGSENNIFYRNPGDTGESTGDLQIHQHALIVEPATPNWEAETLASFIARVAHSSKPIDVRHVLDDSLFSRVMGAWTGFDAIQQED